MAVMMTIKIFSEDKHPVCKLYFIPQQQSMNEDCQNCMNIVTVSNPIAPLLASVMANLLFSEEKSVVVREEPKSQR